MSTPAGPSPAALAAAHEFNVEAFTLLAIAILFVFLRTLQRVLSVGVKKFQLDDYLMLFAVVLYGLETGAAYSVGAWFHGLANNGMTTEERMALKPHSPEWNTRVDGSKLQIIGWNLYSLLLWTLKLCMCVFYNRLTAGIDNMAIRIRVGYAAIGATYVAVVFSILLACHPLQKSWQIYPDPGNTCQPAISKVNCLVVVVLNVVTDLYLMTIPLPLLFRAQMPLKRKALLIFMFSGGFFVIACGILRCSLILIDPVTGAQQAGSWAVRETFVSVIIGNLPMVYKLFRLATRKGSDTIRSNRTNGHYRLEQLESGGSDIKGFHVSGGYVGKSGMSTQVSKKSRFLHPLSMRNITYSGSDDELPLDNIKENGVVMTTELSIQETQRVMTPNGSSPISPDGSVAHIAQLRDQLYAKE